MSLPTRQAGRRLPMKCTTWHEPHASSFMSTTMSKSRLWISQHSTLPLNGTAYAARLFGATTTLCARTRSCCSLNISRRNSVYNQHISDARALTVVITKREKVSAFSLFYYVAQVNSHYYATSRIEIMTNFVRN